MDKDEKFIKNWEETRSRGRLRYALVEGTIFGIVLMFVQVVATMLSKPAENYFNQKIVWVVLLNILGGMLAYWLVFWPMNEYYYRKKLSKRQNNTDE